MSPEQINDLFDTMGTAVRTLGDASRAPAPDPTDPLTALRPAPAAAAPAPVAPEKPPAITDDEVRGAFDPSSEVYDPRSMVGRLVTESYGPLVGDINLRAIQGMFGRFEKHFADFKDYEEDVMNSLRGVPPAAVNETMVAQAYLMAKGMKVTLKERETAAQAAGATTIEPSVPEVVTPEPELSAVEVEVAKKMFAKYDDPLAQYRLRSKQIEGGPVTVQVPIGGGKKA